MYIGTASKHEFSYPILTFLKDSLAESAPCHFIGTSGVPSLACLALVQIIISLRTQSSSQITKVLSDCFAFEDSREPTPVPATDNMALEAIMSLWERQRQNNLPGEDVAIETWEWDGIDEDELQDGDESWDLRHYRDVLINSPAYLWLGSTVDAEMKHESLGKDVRTAIRDQIVSALKSISKTKLSRRAAPPTNHMTFSIHRNLDEFFDFQEYDIAPHEALPRVLVLVGTDNNVQCSTVLDYVSTVWPFYGPKLIALYQAILRDGNECTATCEYFDSPETYFQELHLMCILPRQVRYPTTRG